ncbi:hypothetical protein AK88_01097 [Plasmodium fragile]|uniref:ATP-dependent RNA helicase n=1 Tax=Plasmodium fragile TaxID=5857 RepID=A0A0D9QQ84_PLAFR|nr:uncharacterized protein AK88_01097 [Plasmodium fragile]KJP89219.1 hypothetical protein AK88_01097 [Plasmodium fragile]
MLSYLLLIAFILTPFVITSPCGGAHARGRCAPTFIGRTLPFQITKNKIHHRYRKKKGTYVIRARGGHYQEESRKGEGRDKRRSGSSGDDREDAQTEGESTPIHKHSVKKRTRNVPGILKRRRKKIYTKEEVKAEKDRQLKGKLRRKNDLGQGIRKKGKKRDRRINNTDGADHVQRQTDLANDTRGDTPNEGKRKHRGRRTSRGRRTPSRKEQKILDMFQNDLNESIERLNKKTKKYELCRQNENLKNGMQSNEILRKVLAAGRSSGGRSRGGERKGRTEQRGSSPPRVHAVQMNRRLGRYVDDISDDAGEGKNKNLHENTQKETNEEQKVQLYSSPCREGKTHKGNTHGKEKKTNLGETNMVKLNQSKGRNFPLEEDPDKDVETNESMHTDQVEGDNLKQIKATIKIGKSVDPFRRKIQINYENSALSDGARKRLAKFSSIIDLNADGGEKKRDTKEDAKATKEKYLTFEELGICDNFLNVYLKYNGIEKPTEYQAKFIPLLIFFMNNGYSDWRNCSGGGANMWGEASAPPTTSLLPTTTTPVERIIYVNKYNERSGKLVRTFFLHCPTGTGKTLMYVLPLFQHITNVCFGVTPCWDKTEEGELPRVDGESEGSSNETSCPYAASTSYASTPQEEETFYVRKEINADVTSFLCSNVKQEQQHFITKNRRNVAAMVNTLTRTNSPGEELAVQIYHLCKDLIDSFFKSSRSKFFELNDSLLWSHLPKVDQQRRTLLERLNVDLKKKKNLNVHLLIGGNNIKYQVKGLKRPKLHLAEESPEESSKGGAGKAPSLGEDPPEEHLPTMQEDPIEHVNIYVGTPGRLERLINEKQIINLDNISTIVLDEYDFFFNSYGKSNEGTKTDKPQVENEFFSNILRSIYSTTKKGQPGRSPLLSWNSLTNVICCSATPAVYSYLTFTRHIITTNFLRHLHGEKESFERKEADVDGEAPEGGHSSGKGFVPGNRPPIDRKLEQSMLNELFNLKEFGRIPSNLIHLNYTYDRRNREWSNSATMNFLNVLFSNPLRKNVLVFCNTKKRVMDLWSLFRNRFDVDIQTIFAEKNKKRKKIFKDINYANFFKNDLVDYKNLKKYVNFMFLSTNLLYRGINCMGFTTIVNIDMPSDPNEYVHRCGRIGRINNKGIIINIFEQSFRRTYNRRIFSKLGIQPYDIDCYMNNLFTLGKGEVQGDVGKEVCKKSGQVDQVELQSGLRDDSRQH